MKLLEKTELEKQKLLDASNHYKKEIESEMKSISKNTEQAVTNAIFIGGALALTYFAVSRLIGSKKKNRNSKRSGDNGNIERDEDEQSSAPNIFSHVSEIVITQATMMLLEFAREKLAEYLESRKANNENS